MEQINGEDALFSKRGVIVRQDTGRRLGREPVGSNNNSFINNKNHNNTKNNTKTISFIIIFKVSYDSSFFCGLK